MKALLRKDFYLMLRPVSLLLLLVFSLGAMVSLSTQNQETTVSDLVMFGAMITLLSSVFPLACLGEDEHSRWEQFAATMPFNKRVYISEKYLLSVIHSLYFTLALTAGTSVWMLKYSCFDIQRLFLLMSVNLFTAALLYSISLPVTFRFGSLKGTLMMIILLVCFLFGVVLVISSNARSVNLQAITGWIQNNRLLLSLCLLLVSAAMLLLSLLLSVRLFRKKQY